jgi:hypothetical protein
VSEILSDDERHSIYARAYDDADNGRHRAGLRAVERAVVEKLAAMGGEMPPVSPHNHPEPQTMMWTGLEIAWIHEYARAERAKGVAAGMAQERARWGKPVEWAIRYRGALSGNFATEAEAREALAGRNATAPGTAEHRELVALQVHPANDDKEQTR